MKKSGAQGRGDGFLHGILKKRKGRQTRRSASEETGERRRKKKGRISGLFYTRCFTD